MKILTIFYERMEMRGRFVLLTDLSDITDFSDIHEVACDYKLGNDPYLSPKLAEKKRNTYRPGRNRGDQESEIFYLSSSILDNGGLGSKLQYNVLV